MSSRVAELGLHGINLGHRQRFANEKLRMLENKNHSVDAADAKAHKAIASNDSSVWAHGVCE